jgi:hypothetical protein
VQVKAEEAFSETSKERKLREKLEASVKVHNFFSKFFS